MARQWFFQKDGQQRGPVSSAEINELVTAGRLLPSDLVWTKGLTRWVVARIVPVLPFAAPAEATSSSSPQAAEQPAVWTSRTAKSLAEKIGIGAIVAIAVFTIGGVFVLLNTENAAPGPTVAPAAEASAKPTGQPPIPGMSKPEEVTSDGMTHEAFAELLPAVFALKPGMRAADVVRLLGQPHAITEHYSDGKGTTLAIMTWRSKDDENSSIVLNFEDGLLDSGGTSVYDIKNGFKSPPLPHLPPNPVGCIDRPQNCARQDSNL